MAFPCITVAVSYSDLPSPDPPAPSQAGPLPPPRESPPCFQVPCSGFFSLPILHLMFSLSHHGLLPSIMVYTHMMHVHTYIYDACTHMHIYDICTHTYAQLWFRTWEKTQCICPFESGLFCLTYWFLALSIFLQASWFHFSVWLNTIPLGIEGAFSLSIQLLVAVWAGSKLG